MIERVAAIERNTQAVAAAAEQQTAATGEIARNVIGTSEAMRLVAGQMGAVTDEARNTGAAVGEMRTLAEAVGSNIAEVRRVMVRIVRTSSDAANRRTAQRLSADTPATLVLGGRAMPATCLDLSAGGARVRVADALIKGGQVILRMAGLPDLPGRVLEAGEEAGLSFEWAVEDAPPELLAHLRTLAAA